eukprot:jgi/Bigna1/90091/estExt_fgenesh1_pg.C_620025
MYLWILFSASTTAFGSGNAIGRKSNCYSYKRGVASFSRIVQTPKTLRRRRVYMNELGVHTQHRDINLARIYGHSSLSRLHAVKDQPEAEGIDRQSSLQSLNSSMGIFEQVIDMVRDTVELSYQRFYSAIDGGSTGWSDWVDDVSRKELLQTIKRVGIDKDASMLWEWCHDSPYVTTLELAKGKGFEARVLVVPDGTRMTRHYPPGCMMMSTVLHGACSVRSYITSTRQGSNVTRETAYHKYNVKSNPWVYYGGPQRVIKASGKADVAVILEITLMPPARLSPIYKQHTTGLRILPVDNSSRALGKMFREIRVINQTAAGSTATTDTRGDDDDTTAFSIQDTRMRVGGLDDALVNITRRIFATRRFPPRTIEKLGLQHVRGMLLYGPPGCGKTLLAREIATALNARKPKIVSGPEILNKWVGEAEKSIRGLFVEAEREQREKGRESKLHVVILDEMDAVCKVRGSVSDGGVRDSVVNQLLAKLDGVDQLHNLLVIGLTNRRELIDPALLRPGRLEVQMYVGLPNTKARQEILNVHLSAIIRNGFATDDAIEMFQSGTISESTKGFSGAELAGLVRSAMSFAIMRAESSDELQLTAEDLKKALAELEASHDRFGAAGGEHSGQQRPSLMRRIVNLLGRRKTSSTSNDGRDEDHLRLHDMKEDRQASTSVSVP